MKKNNRGIHVCRISILLISSILVFACHGKKNSPNRKAALIDSSKEGLATYKKPPSSYHDTLVIEPGAAVFYNPDSSQLARIKSIRKKNDFETEEHYCIYLMRNARLLLKKAWRQVHIYETSVARYLLFVKKDKSKICIDLNEKSDMCGVFLFDGEKEPELADMMNFDTALRFYFVK